MTTTRLTLAVLGDSIAYGQGASRPEHAIGPRLAAELTAAGTPAGLVVHAVPGARSADLAVQTSRTTVSGPTVAVIIIGANDVIHFVPADLAARLLADAVRRLRTAGAHVVVAPAPDLSALPWVPPALRPAVQAASANLRQAQTRAALDEGARVATVDGRAGAAFSDDPGLFSADRFHPSSAGYAVIAAALSPAVHAAAAAALAPPAGPA